MDGSPAPVLRGNVSLLTVPVPPGAETVELWFESAAYRTGKLISFASLLLVAGGLAAPVVRRRMARA